MTISAAPLSTTSGWTSFRVDWSILTSVLFLSSLHFLSLLSDGLGPVAARDLPKKKKDKGQNEKRKRKREKGKLKRGKNDKGKTC